MKNTLEHQGYLGSVEVDVGENRLYGKLLYIDDVVTYEGNTVAELSAAFRDAVDDYLSTCKELGDEPCVPFKGTFNVRVGPVIHRDAVLTARGRGQSLNEFVSEAISAHVKTVRVETHHHHYHFSGEVEEPFDTVGEPIQIPEDVSGWHQGANGASIN